MAVVLGAVGAAAAMLRESMNADGMNYLDMGDAYLRGDWDIAINGTWSPLYSWIVGAAMELVEPSMRWEIPVVHAVNFCIYLLALVAFEFFWRQVTREYYSDAASTPGGPAIRLPRWAWLSMGYGLFIWSSLALIEVYSVTPDMLVAVCVFVAAGLVIGIGRGKNAAGMMTLLGLVLGLGYLAKAALFPLALVFLAVALLVQRGSSRPLLKTLPAFFAFALIAGPFIALLSSKKGHLTFSEVGKLTYLKHVHEVPFPHWQPGVVDGLGTPEHPPRRIGEEPTVWEFAGPVGGTYPLSYDPYYWYEGLDVPFDMGRQLKALAVNGTYYFELFFRTQGMFLGIALVLLLLARKSAGDLRGSRGWALIAIAVVALGMYALVHVTGRYIAAFVVLLWAGFLLYARLPARSARPALLAVCGGGLVFAVAANIATFHLDGLNALLGIVPGSGATVSATPSVSARPSEVARGVTELGLEEGDRVGFIGHSFDAFDAFWARLARLKIVAEIVPEDAEAFWRTDPAQQAQILGAFESAGATAVVAEQIPERVPEGWQRIGDTSYYAYLFGSAGRGRIGRLPTRTPEQKLVAAQSTVTLTIPLQVR